MDDFYYHEASREDLEKFQGELKRASEIWQNIPVLPVNYQMISAKKRKAKKVSTTIAEKAGDLAAVTNYDDGQMRIVRLLMNVTGVGKITVVTFPEEYCQCEIADISFDCGGRHVVFPLPTTGAKLYRAFLEAGIYFQGFFSESEIAKMLAKYYLPRLRGEPRILFIPLAGWEGDKFSTAMDLTWLEDQKGEVHDALRKIPLSRKFLQEKLASSVDLRFYIGVLKCFKDMRIRFLLLVQPFLAIISSVLDEVVPIPCLNIIAEGRIRQNIQYLLQTFERNKPRIYNAAESHKKIQEILATVRDETVSFAADSSDFMTAYQQKKIRQNVECIIAILQGQQMLEPPYMRKVTAGGVLFSNYKIPDDRLITLYITEDDVHENFFEISKFDEKDVPGRAFAAFVGFAENFMSKIRKRLKEKRWNTEEILGFIFQLLEEMFQEKGVRLSQEMNLNFQKIIANLRDETADDESEIFRKIMRREIQELVVVEKCRADYADMAMIYYSEDFLWIPSELFDLILRKNHMLASRKKILYELKEKGAIVADCGLTKRIQIAKKRFESVQFRRDFFTKTGEVEIINLGMENADDY